MKETLKSMLNNLINDRQEEASLDLHNYINDKMKTVSGITESKKYSDQTSLNESNQFSGNITVGQEVVIQYNMTGGESMPSPTNYKNVGALYKFRNQLSPQLLKKVGVTGNVEDAEYPLEDYVVYTLKGTTLSKDEIIANINARASKKKVEDRNFG